MKRVAVVGAACLLAAGCFTAAAVEVANLYETEVPVGSQDTAVREAASRSALEQVLIKVSGDDQTPRQPQLKSLLSQAGQLVQSYQYRDIGQGSPAAAAQPAPGQMLWVSFDRQTINQRLFDAGLPVWSGNRPMILLWAAVEEGANRTMVGGDSRADWRTEIENEAKRWGLPVRVPLLDLQDQGALTATDVWGNFSDVISKASERYQPDAVLVGRIYPAGAAGGDKWQSGWTLYHRGDTESWEGGEGAAADAVTAGMRGAAARLSKRYALVLTPGSSAHASIIVENVSSLTDYARALRYLQSLDPVAEVWVGQVEGAKVVYEVKVRGQPQGLVQAIDMGRTLAATAAEGAGAANQEYHYRLVP